VDCIANDVPERERCGFYGVTLVLLPLSTHTECDD
jgi:hypothetical protein